MSYEAAVERFKGLPEPFYSEAIQLDESAQQDELIDMLLGYIQSLQMEVYELNAEYEDMCRYSGVRDCD